VLAGCGGGDEEGKSVINEDGSITVDMVEESDSGQSGKATFYRLQGENTRIVIEVDGGGDGPFPAYVHENACNRPDPTLTDRLKPVIDGRSETVIPVSFQHLRTSPHSLIVHKSPDALDDYVSCGSIGRLGSPEREESLLER
jgi:hypothetical protein